MTILVFDLDYEGQLVSRLSSFKDGKALSWGDAGMAAEAIMRLRSALNLELDRVQALEARLSKAPHGRSCPATWYKAGSSFNGPCTCWKAAL